MIELKKICFFSGDITNGGGTERVGTIIANELSKNDKYDISFVSLVEKQEHPFFEIYDNINRYSLFDQPVRGVTNIHRICYRLIKLIKKEKFEIIVDIDGILDMYSLIAKVITKVKVISWEHFNYYQHPDVGYRKYTRWLAGRFADTIITLTEEDKGYYLKYLKINCPIEAIHNPIIGLDNIKQYNCSSKVLLSVGNLIPLKGFDLLLEVANVILHIHKDWIWIILGEGEERINLEAKIKEYNLEQRVILKGKVSNIGDYYAKTGIFVMTSRHEGLPMTLLETKQYQLPAISFDIKTGPRECIINNKNGYLIPAFDIQEMIVKISKLIEDQYLRYEFSQHVLDDSEKFSIEVVINLWDEVFSSLER